MNNNHLTKDEKFNGSYYNKHSYGENTENLTLSLKSDGTSNLLHYISDKTDVPDCVSTISESNTTYSGTYEIESNSGTTYKLKCVFTGKKTDGKFASVDCLVKENQTKTGKTDEEQVISQTASFTVDLGNHQVKISAETNFINATDNLRS